MHAAVAELLELLELERIEAFLFRGRNERAAGPRVFGGQVMAQALRAAAATVDGPLPHSMHAYFLRPGASKLPIVYEVEPIRDGRSFATRRIVAVQRGEAIFSTSVSFQRVEPGLEHDAPVPPWPAPEELEDDVAVARRLEGRDPNVMPWATRERPFEARSVHPFGSPGPEGPVKPAWYRLRSTVDADPVLHRCLLAYVSDMGLLSTSLVPHQGRVPRSHVIGASLDHALWFHRDLRVDDWLLYDRDSPTAGGSRGFNRGSFFDRAGRLVASTAQESLVRVRRDLE
jgi:acyl-CoA thioesterase-2